ncbi:MAG: alpha/beta hydrolase [Gammaproteobacteria bacterium]|nr:alpha/beta hydrolase [Gammaproteobacteria bacterium]
MSSSKMDAWEDRSFDVNGLQIHTKIWGPKEGEKVIALHGWLDNAASFDLLAAQLPDLRICAVDLVGHGLSDHRPGWGHYYFNEYVFDVLELANQLGWDQYSLMGHSMGAHLSLMTAGTEPNLVKKLMLLEGFGAPSMVSPETIPILAQTAFRKTIGLREKKAPVYADLDAATQARVNGFFKIEASAARLLCDRGSRKTEGGISFRSDPRLRFISSSAASHNEFCSYIRAVSAPTCLILAEEGVPRDEAEMQERIHAHKNLQVEYLPGGHHLHMEEQSTDVARIVAEFFETKHLPL